MHPRYTNVLAMFHVDRRMQKQISQLRVKVGIPRNGFRQEPAARIIWEVKQLQRKKFKHIVNRTEGEFFKLIKSYYPVLDGEEFREYFKDYFLNGQYIFRSGSEHFSNVLSVTDEMGYWGEGPTVHIILKPDATINELNNYVKKHASFITHTLKQFSNKMNKKRVRYRMAKNSERDLYIFKLVQLDKFTLQKLSGLSEGDKYTIVAGIVSKKYGKRIYEDTVRAVLAQFSKLRRGV